MKKIKRLICILLSLSMLPCLASGSANRMNITDFNENNEHRHLSRLYCEWSLTETKKDDDLKLSAFRLTKMLKQFIF